MCLCCTYPLQAVQATLSNITVVACHQIHALLSSLDQLATQAATMVSDSAASTTHAPTIMPPPARKNVHLPSDLSSYATIPTRHVVLAGPQSLAKAANHRLHICPAISGDWQPTAQPRYASVNSIKTPTSVLALVKCVQLCCMWACLCACRPRPCC